MITNEIFIDLIEFIVPARISENQFRDNWSTYDWENKVVISTGLR